MSIRDHTDTPMGRLAHWVDVRVGASKFVRSKLDYVFPEHFSFLFGEVALYSFVVLVLTGTFLALFYTPSEQDVIYQGSYVPLQGVTVSEAYKSVVDLSFNVRAGLLIRQTHHWAALIFLAAIFAHMCRVFFTGAFRRPREINWITGVFLLLLGMVEGYVGYSLLDDVLSGTGNRIGYSILESLPVIGVWVSRLVFGGEYPGNGVLGRFFTVHIFVLPALLVALISAHLALLVRQHHTQFPGPGRTERNVVGSKAWPTYATKSIGLLLMIAGVLTLMGGTLQINPVWLYGPYDPFVISSGAQADWYVLWVQGALRLMPGVSLDLGEYTVPNHFFPGVLFPVVVFGLLLAWPFLEAAVTGDRRTHHLLERPRDRPARTGIGAAGLTAFAVLLITGSDDIIAATFDWPLVALRRIEQWVFFLGPAAVGLATWKVCRDLAERAAEQPVEEALFVTPPPASATATDPDPPAAAPSTVGRLRRGVLTAAIVAAVSTAVVDRLRNRSRR